MAPSVHWSGSGCPCIIWLMSSWMKWLGVCMWLCIFPRVSHLFLWLCCFPGALLCFGFHVGYMAWWSMCLFLVSFVLLRPLVKRVLICWSCCGMMWECASSCSVSRGIICSHISPVMYSMSSSSFPGVVWKHVLIRSVHLSCRSSMVLVAFRRFCIACSVCPFSPGLLFGVAIWGWGCFYLLIFVV